jgi:Limiting CO2-inducible proteins B/C beta carbonyic anhydrases
VPTEQGPAGSEATDLLDDSVGIADFVQWSEWALARVGFRPSNCLVLVATCRDELMSAFDIAVKEVWGGQFEVGALAGQVFLGRTGMAAALSHTPGEDGRHRLVVFCFPHVGVGAGGAVGLVQRRGISRASSACGALIAFRAQLASGDCDVSLDPHDVEQSLLRMRLSRMLRDDRVPTLAELTELARQAAVEDMRIYVDLARGNEPVDVAYLSGIVVHLPDGLDVVSSVTARVVIDGVPLDLPH